MNILIRVLRILIIGIVGVALRVWLILILDEVLEDAIDMTFSCRVILLIFLVVVIALVLA